MFIISIETTNFQNFTIGKHTLIKIINNIKVNVDFYIKYSSFSFMNTTTSKNLIVTEYSELLQIHINNCLWRYINTGWLDLVADVLEINHTIVDTKEYITNTKYVKNSLIISSLLNNLTILSSEFIGNSATVEGGVIIINKQIFLIFNNLFR